VQHHYTVAAPEAVRTRTHAQVQLYLVRSVHGARGHASGTRLKAHLMLTRTTGLHHLFLISH
jgi:hypothetical protein